MAKRVLHRRYGNSHVAKSDVVFEASEGWWVASVPNVPGAYSQGRTKNSAYNNLLSAMSGLAALREEGLIK